MWNCRGVELSWFVVGKGSRDRVEGFSCAELEGVCVFVCAD